uniref:Uncharacterized protein n=1 Tax=Branchiostoma floridae TaxID=7739 RepID=C3Y2I2_BRAFL|eukprot:XP_002609527.1 hypothetical protein BRAFLDRAFT_96636 [Branchiostoma floridae]
MFPYDPLCEKDTLCGVLCQSAAPTRPELPARQAGCRQSAEVLERLLSGSHCRIDHGFIWMFGQRCRTNVRPELTEFVNYRLDFNLIYLNTRAQLCGVLCRSAATRATSSSSRMQTERRGVGEGANVLITHAGLTDTAASADTISTRAYRWVIYSRSLSLKKQDR